MTGKRCGCLAVFYLFAVMLTACGAGEEPAEEAYWTWAYPQTIRNEEELQELKEVLDLVVYTEYDVYPTDTETVAGYIKNLNPGVGFMVFKDMILERLSDGEWIQVNTTEPNFGLIGWGILEYDPPLPELQYVTRKSYYMPYVADEIEPGEYRLVIFSEIGPLYAPFRFVTPEEYAELSAAGKIESRVTYLTPKS